MLLRFSTIPPARPNTTLTFPLWDSGDTLAAQTSLRPEASLHACVNKPESAVGADAAVALYYDDIHYLSARRVTLVPPNEA